jgi:hypothetical protein
LTVIEGVGVELTSSPVAVTVAAPTPTAVTVVVPLRELAGFTVNTAVLLDTQLTARPVSTLPAASRNVAVNCWVAPMIMGVVGTDNVTVATGASCTVTDDTPVFVSLVAVIVAVPGPTAVTNPFASTLAAVTSLELHVTKRPVSVFPPASFVTAVSCCVGVIPRTRLSVGGVKVTVATGTGFTVRVALPVLPSLIAMICTVPGATAVTTPEVETVAIEELPEVHVAVRSVRILPEPSRIVAVACVVCPAVMLVEASETVTSATGTGTTVMSDVPVLPSLAAVTVAVPIASADTKPLELTLAIDGASENQVTVRPVSMLVAASRVSAASCFVLPTTTFADPGVTTTAATLAITLSALVPVCPPLEARICAEPEATAVTRPLVETVATAALSVVQVIVRPVSGLPFASRTIAVAWVVWASVMVAEASVTLTDATGTADTVTEDDPL